MGWYSTTFEEIQTPKKNILNNWVFFLKLNVPTSLIQDCLDQCVSHKATIDLGQLYMHESDDRKFLELILNIVREILNTEQWKYLPNVGVFLYKPDKRRNEVMEGNLEEVSRRSFLYNNRKNG